MLDGGNPSNSNGGEIISPAGQITEVLWSKVSDFSSESFIGCVHEFTEHLRIGPVAPDELETLAAIQNAAQDHIEQLTQMLDQIIPFVEVVTCTT
jgi:hypothetical protein